ncbi:SpoIIE family protein phosphatase [Nocardia stercoris]|uniref:SpoIIE family protein phosphatase n=1 Tax=Nocardia stercoris TaxID=2483361 RepID=UPI001F1A4774|nr:SpoIIE family protein phosphatase [Nocardia stercoris]
MTVLAAFRESYSQALRLHLDQPSQDTLSEGYELGRRALVEGISILDLTEHHFRLLEGVGLADPEHRTQAGPQRPSGDPKAEAALEFLLQTLAALDVATRGFLDSTRSYERQRLRAEDLAGRDAFRTALVESLQDGFFVADADGTVVEVNSAFGDLTGFGAAGLPYAEPYPWALPEVHDYPTLGAVLRQAPPAARFEMPVRHRDGRRLWLAVSTSSLLKPENDERVFVGTVRDTTAEHDAQARDQAVSRLATAVGAATSVDEVLTVGLEELRRAVGARSAVVSVWPNRLTGPEFYVCDPDSGSGTTDLLSRQVLDARARALLEATRRLPGRAVHAIPEGAASPEGIVAPLGETGDAAVWLSFAAPRAVSAGDWALFSLLVGHLSLAVQRARNFDAARSTSLTLQRAMLGPIELPPRFAVHYEPALPPLEIGGDWYDVVPLRDGTIGLVVGDCVGRGLSAAVVMGQLRTAARALLLRGAGPAQLLAELDTVAARIPGAMCTTVCAAVLDPVGGTVRYSNAGHMPPILAEAGAHGRELDGGRSVPLATFDPPRRPEATTELPPGSTLVLFTDGLVEERGVDIDLRFGDLSDELAGAATRSPREVADAVLSRLRPPAGYDDDVAMVVYRQPPPPLRVEIPAEAARLSGVRRELAAWLVAAAVPAETAGDVVAAANEACSNSVEHAYLGGPAGAVRLVADCTLDRITLTVTDTGVWRPMPPDPGYRGRGIAMMRALSDELSIEHPEGVGTVVRLTVALPAVEFSAAGRYQGVSRLGHTGALSPATNP